MFNFKFGRVYALCVAILVLMVGVAVGEVDKNTLTPVSFDRTTNAMTIYNEDIASISDVLQAYIVGGSTTSAATVEVHVTSVSFTTTEGLHPGTTHWVYSDADQATLTKAINYWNAKATTTVGIEGGVVLSTTSTDYGVIKSTRLQPTSALSCLGSSNYQSFTATAATGKTATYSKYDSSAAFITTGSLFDGTTYFVFSDTDKDTLSEYISYCNAVSSLTAGISGNLSASRVQGAYYEENPDNLSTASGTNILGAGNEQTLTFANQTGISYVLNGLSLASEQQYHITGMSINATFATGTTKLYIYDGVSTSTELMEYEIDSTATETDIGIIPGNGDLAGSENTSMRFDVVGSTWITAGDINIIGYKE